SRPNNHQQSTIDRAIRWRAWRETKQILAGHAKIANREEMALAKDTKNAKDIDKQWRREGYCPEQPLPINRQPAPLGDLRVVGERIKDGSREVRKGRREGRGVNRRIRDRRHTLSNQL
ncbi:MAG: hypothetical protein DRP79_10005, partial [Planctomycetota bacterium]